VLLLMQRTSCVIISPVRLSSWHLRLPVLLVILAVAKTPAQVLALYKDARKVRSAYPISIWCLTLVQLEQAEHPVSRCLQPPSKMESYADFSVIGHYAGILWTALSVTSTVLVLAAGKPPSPGRVLRVLSPCMLACLNT
jgi:hypothetical protein